MEAARNGAACSSSCAKSGPVAQSGSHARAAPAPAGAGTYTLLHDRSQMSSAHFKRQCGLPACPRMFTCENIRTYEDVQAARTVF